MLKPGLLGLLAIAAAGIPATVHAQDATTNVSGSTRRNAEDKFEAWSFYFGQMAKATAPVSKTKTNMP